MLTGVRMSADVSALMCFVMVCLHSDEVHIGACCLVCARAIAEIEITARFHFNGH